MIDARLMAAVNLFPEKRTLIVRLAARSGQFRTLCGDLDEARDQLALCKTDDDRREYGRLLRELEAELSDWIDAAPAPHGGPD